MHAGIVQNTAPTETLTPLPVACQVLDSVTRNYTHPPHVDANKLHPFFVPYQSVRRVSRQLFSTNNTIPSMLTNHMNEGTKCISLFHQSDQPFIVVDQSHFCGHEIYFSPSPMRPPASMFSTNPKHLGMKYIYIFPPIRTPVQQNLDQTDNSWHELPFSPQPARPPHSMLLTNHIIYCGREST